MSDGGRTSWELEKGVTEEEAVKRQGNPGEIAAEILENTDPANLKNRDWRGICLMAVSIFLLICCILPRLLFFGTQRMMNASVGIIGGADGPTSVFVAAKVGEPWGLYMATAVVVVVTVIYFVKKHKERRR